MMLMTVVPQVNASHVGPRHLSLEHCFSQRCDLFLLLPLSRTTSCTLHQTSERKRVGEGGCICLVKRENTPASVLVELQYVCCVRHLDRSHTDSLCFICKITRQTHSILLLLPSFCSVAAGLLTHFIHLPHLRPLPRPPLFVSVSASVSQGSASQMSPPVTTSLIDLRRATGMDLKH